MKKLKPKTIEKALTKAATKKKVATVDRKASTIDGKSSNRQERKLQLDTTQPKMLQLVTKKASILYGKIYNR